MLIHVNMPQQFWSEAIKTVVYTWNLLSYSTIDTKTSHECYYAREAFDLDHLQSFDYLIMMHIPEAYRDKESKFTLRSHDAIFVKYVSLSSWKIYNLTRKCFEMFHNITFFETKFSSEKEFSHLRIMNFRDDDM